MSTNQVAPSQSYPYLFEVTDGPTFQRIADSAKYYHDKTVDMPLYFTGKLTDQFTGKESTVVLKAYAYGFVGGNGCKDGNMLVFLSFDGYYKRFGSRIDYSWRTKSAREPIELGRSTADTPKHLAG